MPVASTPYTTEPLLARTVGGTGPGLLLAHGAGGSVALNYGPILDGLAAGHTVVGVDYPGTGRTPRSAGPLTVDSLADQLIAAADAEGLQRFAISGFSLGGPVAIRAAAKHPDRVSALILTATFAHRDARLDLAAKLWADLYEAGDTLRLSEFLTLVAFSAETLRGMPEQELRTAIDGLAGLIPAGTPEHVDLVRRADVREFAPEAEFDRIVSWFTSFGYFDEATDRALLLLAVDKDGVDLLVVEAQ